MERNKHFFQFLMIGALVHQSQCCWFATEHNRTVCNSFVEAAAEGDDTWQRLNVYNHNTEITLRFNSLSRMPNLVFLQVSNIDVLHLGAFRKLKKLDHLIIYNTSLHLETAKLFGDLKVRMLTIRKNPNFNNLPEKYLAKMPRIRQIDFQDNNFGIIRNNIFSKRDISSVNLDCNNIHTIEKDAFINMPLLAQLSFTGNLLKEFDSRRILGISHSITVFWLSKNQLTKIDHTVLEGLPVVEKLYFEVNNIEYIEPKVFEYTPHLKYLDLSNNKLCDIPANIFPLKGMQQLQQLFLHSNRLTFFNNALFFRMPALKHITYGGNPLQCSCLAELKTIIETKNITSLCDSVYFLGERPTCIIASVKTNECIYDTELTADMYVLYQQALESYPKLEQKCDTHNGFNNAVLREVS